MYPSLKMLNKYLDVAAMMRVIQRIEGGNRKSVIGIFYLFIFRISPTRPDWNINYCHNSKSIT
jgi:hypothetical protein